MPIEITIPSPGESVTEVTIGPWHRSSGEWVEKDDLLVEIESDKVTLEVPAPQSGRLEVLAAQSSEMKVGDVIGRIDPDAPRPAGGEGSTLKSAAATNEVATATAAAPANVQAPAPVLREEEPAAPARATPLARKIAADRGVDLAAVRGSGSAGRIRKADVLAAPLAEAPAVPAVAAPAPAVPAPGDERRPARREKMSRLRLRIAERLVAAQHTAAMLTTFNEADMSAVMALRQKHKQAFTEKHGVGLGFMSFFVKACVSALRAFPRVNAWIVGEEIEYHDYADVSIAVGTERGLVVPVIRNAERLSFAAIEATIADFAARAREGKLTIDEMTGGTFTISNGGIYGSLNSTPILNPPQSGILGMHRIMNRPVEDPQNPGQIVLRPMMYLALSYDHRIVDGSEAVGFLVHVKSMIEAPERLLIEA